MPKFENHRPKNNCHIPEIDSQMSKIDSQILYLYNNPVHPENRRLALPVAIEINPENRRLALPVALEIKLIIIIKSDNNLPN